MTMTATQAQVNRELLATSTPEEWNEIVRLAREADPFFRIDLRNGTLAFMDVQGFDLRMSDFRGTNLEHCNFTDCDLTGSWMEGATVYRANFTRANLTEADFEFTDSNSTAVIDGCIGYRRPLPDITKDVAYAMLRQQIADPTSHVNEGLKELRESGINATWMYQSLQFWISHEVEEMRNYCADGDCDCRDTIEHSCEGCCDCCACYSGQCDCEPDHINETYESGNMFLATVIGRIEFEWHDANGLSAKVVASDRSLHPHISREGTICWGDSPYPYSLRVSDHLLRVLGWIGQHNPGEGEYRSINDLPELT